MVARHMPASLPPGQRFSYWLAEVCRAARDTASVSISAVAELARVDRSTIHRFETLGVWPRHPDVYIAAYAEALGLPDGRDLWSIALNAWRQHGSAPSLPKAPLEKVRQTAEALEREIEGHLGRAEQREAKTRAARTS